MDKYILVDGHKRVQKKIEYTIDSNGCHVCVSHYKNESGYITIKRDGVLQYLHRYMYSLYHGELDEGEVIRHSCDNPSCINIDHLEVGTHTDNMRDMVTRNRSLVGERNNKSKLKEEDVIKIREMLKSNKYTQKEIADIFGITNQMVSNINTRKSWNHI